MMNRILCLALPLLVLVSCTTSRVERQTTAPTATSPVPAATFDVTREIIAGQSIYVPIYSHIYVRDKSSIINLTATLSIRNTDAKNGIRVSAVRYYGTHGTLVREYLTEPLQLGPMASADYVVAEDDTSGGAGANFIVEWEATDTVTAPVVEAVMISTASQQGISFLSAGRVIKDRGR